VNAIKADKEVNGKERETASRQWVILGPQLYLQVYIRPEGDDKVIGPKARLREDYTWQDGITGKHESY